MVKSQIRIAFRNVVRHRRRSAFAISAVAAGVIALLLAGGFIEWSLWYGREAVIRAQLGHFQVVRKGYYEEGVADPRNYLLPAKSADLEMVRSLPGVEVVAPRLSLTGLISHQDSTISFLGEGVDPAAELLLGKAISIKEGVGLSDADPEGVIVGRGLAANLGVGVGDRVVLLTTLSSGGVSAVEVTVRGIFGTITRAYDDSVVRMPMTLARKLAQEDGAHVWAVLLSDESLVPAALEAAAAKLDPGRYDVISWRELSDFYTKTEQLFSRQLGVLKLIVALIILLCIVNTMFMTVAERTAEIGTVLALGTRRREVLSLFLWEGLLVGGFGAAVGVVVGSALAAAISQVGIPMPPPPGGGDSYLAGIRLTFGQVGEAVVLTLVASVLASAFPAFKASRNIIVDALRRAV